MEDYSADIITLTDEENNEYEFEILDKIEYQDNIFYALTPYTSDNDEEISEEPYFILQEIEGEEDTEFVEVTDENLMNILDEKFRKNFSIKFGED